MMGAFSAPSLPLGLVCKHWKQSLPFGLVCKHWKQSLPLESDGLFISIRMHCNHKDKQSLPLIIFCEDYTFGWLWSLDSLYLCKIIIRRKLPYLDFEVFFNTVNVFALGSKSIYIYAFLFVIDICMPQFDKYLYERYLHDTFCMINMCIIDIWHIFVIWIFVR